MTVAPAGIVGLVTAGTSVVVEDCSGKPGSAAGSTVGSGTGAGGVDCSGEPNAGTGETVGVLGCESASEAAVFSILLEDSCVAGIGTTLVLSGAAEVEAILGHDVELGVTGSGFWTVF